MLTIRFPIHVIIQNINASRYEAKQQKCRYARLQASQIHLIDAEYQRPENKQVFGPLPGPQLLKKQQDNFQQMRSFGQRNRFFA
jgi:hypothetical protein